jgi:hypothetical protein
VFEGLGEILKREIQMTPSLVIYGNYFTVGQKPAFCRRKVGQAVFDSNFKAVLVSGKSDGVDMARAMQRVATW